MAVMRHGDDSSLLNPVSVEMSAICQRNPESLKEIGDKFGIEKRYTEYEQVLADPDIDAVHINTPIPNHAEHTLAALRAGM